MTEPLDLEPIKARLTEEYWPLMSSGNPLSGGDTRLHHIAALIAEVERLRAFIQGCTSNDCDRWLYPDGQV